MRVLIAPGSSPRAARRGRRRADGGGTARSLVKIQVEGRQRLPDLLAGHRVGAVALHDAAARAEHLADGKIGDLGAIGHALAFETGEIVAVEALPELEEEPRLADARVTGNSDDWPWPLTAERRAALEQLEVMLAPDEPRHPCRRPQSRDLRADEAVSRDGGGRDRRLQIPAPLQKGNGRRAHHDAGVAAGAQQGVQRHGHFPLGVVVDLDGVAHVADHRLGDGMATATLRSSARSLTRAAARWIAAWRRASRDGGVPRPAPARTLRRGRLRSAPRRGRRRC